MAAALELPVTARSPPQRYHNSFPWRGYSINYRVEGPEDGPPVVLIHGFGASVGHYRNNIPALAQAGYRTYAIDLLGFGGSDKPKDANYSMELWLDLMLDFIESMSRNASERWVVMGNSIGGLLTLMITAALQESGRVRGSVLFNSAGGMVSFRREEVPWFLFPVWWFFNNVIFGDFYGPQFFKNFKTRANVEQILKQQVYVRKEVVDEELLDILLAPSDDDGACEVFLKVFRGPPGPSPEELLPNIKTKILAIWGDSDPWTPLATGLHPGIKFSEYCSSLQLLVLPKTAHCPHDERPEECNAAVLKFVDGLEQ